MARKTSNSKWVWVVALLVVAGFYLYTRNAKEPMGADVATEAKAETPKLNGDSPKTESETSTASGLELPAVGNMGQLLKRVGYTVLYDSNTKLPLWVAWRLTADHADGPYNRNGLKFAEDDEVPEPRATNDDYRGSGFDRGHMCPSGDNKWSEEAQLQSFLYTNCCPQLHALNAGDWNELEQRCRAWAKNYGDVYIVSGPLLAEGVAHQTIGTHKVVVPERFFKVVLRMGDNPAAIGFVCDNADVRGALNDYVVTVDEVERLTDFDFFPSLPDEVENKVESEAELKQWKTK